MQMTWLFAAYRGHRSAHYTGSLQNDIDVARNTRDYAERSLLDESPIFATKKYVQLYASHWAVG